MDQLFVSMSVSIICGTQRVTAAVIVAAIVWVVVGVVAVTTAAIGAVPAAEAQMISFLAPYIRRTYNTHPLILCTGSFTRLRMYQCGLCGIIQSGRLIGGHVQF